MTLTLTYIWSPCLTNLKTHMIDLIQFIQHVHDDVKITVKLDKYIIEYSDNLIINLPVGSCWTLKYQTFTVVFNFI